MIFSTEFFTSLKVLCLAKIIDSLKMNTDGMCRVMYFFYSFYTIISIPFHGFVSCDTVEWYD